jgi:hypothetical protein
VEDALLSKHQLEALMEEIGYNDSPWGSCVSEVANQYPLGPACVVVHEGRFLKFSKTPADFMQQVSSSTGLIEDLSYRPPFSSSVVLSFKSKEEAWNFKKNSLQLDNNEKALVSVHEDLVQWRRVDVPFPSAILPYKPPPSNISLEIQKMTNNMNE